MTVADLIAELQHFPPHKPVRVVPSNVCILSEAGEFHESLTVEDSTEADQVTHEGAFILIRGK